MSAGQPQTSSLLVFAMDSAVASLRDSDGPLVPFVVTKENDQPELHTFLEDSLEESLAAAKRFARVECRGVAAVLVYDGDLVVGDARAEAIYAETIDSAGSIAVVAQRFRPRTRLRKFELIGNPVHLAVKGLL
jgi:hypothetical protein